MIIRYVYIVKCNRVSVWIYTLILIIIGAMILIISGVSSWIFDFSKCVCLFYFLGFVLRLQSSFVHRYIKRKCERKTKNYTFMTHTLCTQMIATLMFMWWGGNAMRFSFFFHSVYRTSMLWMSYDRWITNDECYDLHLIHSMT